jgi:hypothetical protein
MSLITYCIIVLVFVSALGEQPKPKVAQVPSAKAPAKGAPLTTQKRSQKSPQLPDVQRKAILGELEKLKAQAKQLAGSVANSKADKDLINANAAPKDLINANAAPKDAAPKELQATTAAPPGEVEDNWMQEEGRIGGAKAVEKQYAEQPLFPGVDVRKKEPEPEVEQDKPAEGGAEKEGEIEDDQAREEQDHANEEKAAAEEGSEEDKEEKEEEEEEQKEDVGEVAVIRSVPSDQAQAAEPSKASLMKLPLLAALMSFAGMLAYSLKMVYKIFERRRGQSAQKGVAPAPKATRNTVDLDFEDLEHALDATLAPSDVAVAPAPVVRKQVKQEVEASPSGWDIDLNSDQEAGSEAGWGDAAWDKESWDDGSEAEAAVANS